MLASYKQSIRSYVFTSILPAPFGCETKLLASCSDGCVRMLGADGCGTWDGAEVQEAEFGETFETPVVYTFVDDQICAVAIMPDAGLVVAGHLYGRISLWQAESGEFRRAVDLEVQRGEGAVQSIDVSLDESLAVFGHRHGNVLVWDTATWHCRFTLKGQAHCGVACGVACARISADAKTIVTVDMTGEARVWNAEIGSTTRDHEQRRALSVVKTGLGSRDIFFDPEQCRGAISLDGRHFLFATQDLSDEWSGKVFDLRHGRLSFWRKNLSVFFKSEDPSGWNSLLKGCNDAVGLGEYEDEERWNFGAGRAD